MRVTGVAVTVGLLLAAVGAVGAATRLDRLHVRTDAAWVALDGALRRRALMVDGLAGTAALNCAADALLRARAHVTLRAGADATREEVENELGWALAVLDRTELGPVYSARLADAEQRVVIARRVYNDAVRDTLALRTHRTVRWLRLAGTAPMPRYFEIAEPLTSS